MPNDNIFITTADKPALVNTTKPMYAFNNTNVNMEPPNSILALKTTSNMPINNDAQLATAKQKAFTELLAVSNGSAITNSYEPKPIKFLSPEEQAKADELKKWEERRAQVKKIEKTCKSITDYNLLEEADDYLDFLDWGDNFKDGLNKFPESDSVLAAMMACMQAGMKKGMKLVKTALPFITGQGGIGSASKIIDTYGGKNIKGLSKNMSSLTKNMKQSSKSLDSFSKLVGGTSSYNKFDLIGTSGRGYGTNSLTSMTDDLMKKNPIGKLLDPSAVNSKLYSVKRCSDSTTKGLGAVTSVFGGIGGHDINAENEVLHDVKMAAAATYK